MFCLIASIFENGSPVLLGVFDQQVFDPIEPYLRKLAAEYNCGVALNYKIDTYLSTSENTVWDIYDVCWEKIGRINQVRLEPGQLVNNLLY